MISARTAFNFLLLFWLSTSCIDSHTTQRAPVNSRAEQEAAVDDFNPFLELASALGGAAGGNGGGAGALGGIVSLVGNLMQNQDSGKAAGGANIGSIIAGVSSLFANGGGAGGGGGFDPSLIGNVIEMFAGGNENAGGQRAKRGAQENAGSGGPNWESLLDIAMTFMGNQNGGGGGQGNQQRKRSGGEESGLGGGLMSLLPMVMNVVNSFNSPQGEKIAAAHKDHAWILPPFLEKIHIMWDHFQQSELAQVLWVQTGLHKVFRGFTDRDGRMDYEKLFKSLENQSFRRRWIKAATDYAADFANYIAKPDVYMQ